VYFGGGYGERFYYILRNRWKSSRDRFGPSKDRFSPSKNTLVESMPGKHRKVVSLILSTVFG